MTKKAAKLLFVMHAKSIWWFVGIYAAIMVLVRVVFPDVPLTGASWIPTSVAGALRVYFLALGIIYPLLATRLYVSQGITRKQFFWAYVDAIAKLSLILVIPIVALEAYFSGFSLLSAITHYLFLPLFFLIGWTAVVGFQMRKWSTATLGIAASLAVLSVIGFITETLAVSELSVLGSLSILLAALLMILPPIISHVPLKP